MQKTRKLISPRWISVLIWFSLLVPVPVIALKPVDRTDIVIFGAGPDFAPPVFNWMVPSFTGPGMGQSVWEPLFILNYETGQIEPWLGLSFISNHSLDVWTLKLRPGVKWADGEDYDAKDVVFTIETLLNDKTQTLIEAASMQHWVDDVELIDYLTVRFKLKHPNPRFQLDYFSVRVASSVIILPQHIWQGKDPFTFENFNLQQGWPLGTGPYRLVQATGREFTYDRRDDWWGAEVGFEDLPQPKRLRWIVTGAEESRAMMAASDELDVIGSLTLGAFDAVRSMNPNLVAWKEQMPYVWLDPCPRQLSLNHQVKPWDQPDMRRAISLIIDRQQIVRIAYEGTSWPSKSIFVEYEGMKPYIDAIQELWVSSRSDVASGKKMIESQGWQPGNDKFYQKEGRVLSLNIQTHAADIKLRRVATVVVEQLRAAGIDASTRPIEGSTWSQNKAFGNFEAVVDWDACGSVNEPWVSMNRFTRQYYRPINERSISNNNFVRWQGEKNDKYSQLVAEIGVLPLREPKIMPRFREAMQIFMTEQVVIPLNQAIMLIPFNNTYWTGWPTEKNNYIHPPMWWMSGHRVIHQLKKAR